jgi:hypothetical protein
MERRVNLETICYVSPIPLRCSLTHIFFLSRLDGQQSERTHPHPLHAVTPNLHLISVHAFEMHLNQAAAVTQCFDHFHRIYLYAKEVEDSKKKIHFISLFISSLSLVSLQFTAHDCVSPEWSGRRKSSAHSKPNHSIACKGSSRGRKQSLG